MKSSQVKSQRSSQDREHRKYSFVYEADPEAESQSPSKRVWDSSLSSERGSNNHSAETRNKRSPRSQLDHQSASQKTQSEDPDHYDTSPIPSSRIRNENSSEGALHLYTEMEAPELTSNAVHKFWGMIRLESEGFSSPKPTALHDSLEAPSGGVSMDFVVMIDRSSSMNQDNKMAFVQATIEYMISLLGPQHRFCLLTFNQEANMVTEGLMEMNAENKKTVLSLLKEIRAEGSTNIGEALTTGITVLNSREGRHVDNLSTIMLFTDGLANMGARGDKLLHRLKHSPLPEGLAIHSFGYGIDHDSNLLQNLSIASRGGVYYYIENTECIATMFGECLAGILSTVAHNVQVEMSAADGCRIVAFYTRYSVQQIKEVKDYNIHMGSIYNHESKTILFKLSLRKMELPMRGSKLVNITVRYVDTNLHKTMVATGKLIVDRPSRAKIHPLPCALDWGINRFAAAATIEEASMKASSGDFSGAQRHIATMISSVKSSISYAHPTSSSQCDDLVKDLQECMIGMDRSENFVRGVHYANAYSTMYYLERSNGTRNFTGMSNTQDVHRGKAGHKGMRRNDGYGYLTPVQLQEAFRAQNAARAYVTGYL